MFVRYGEQLTLAVLIVFVSIINVVWISQDTRPQPGADPNHYLIKTLEFVDGVGEHGAGQLWQSASEMSLQGRPPLYQLITVPFIYLFGRSADAALSVNILFEAILLLSTYGIGRLASNGKAGLLAALLVATYPPIVGLSRIYRPHFAVPACVALSLWLLLLLLKTRRRSVAWLFGASLGFGMLVHPNVFYAVAAPAVVFGLYMLLFQIRPQRPCKVKGVPRWLLAKLGDSFVLSGLLPAAFISAGLVAAWYLPHNQAIFALRQAVGANWSDQAYGFPGVSPSFWWYALTAPGAISYVFTALLAIGLVAGTIRRQKGLSLLATVFLIAYIGFGLRPGDLAWMHFAAALPVAAALTAATVVKACGWLAPSRTDADEGNVPGSRVAPRARVGRMVAAAVTLVCVGVAAFNFSVATWGVQRWSRPFAVLLGAPLNSHTCLGTRMTTAFCDNRAIGEDWPVSEILQIVLDDRECQQRDCRLVIVPKADSFNSFVFDYHLVRDFPEYRDRVTLSTADGWAGEGRDGEWVVSDYILYIPRGLGLGGDRGRQVRAAVTEFLESPPRVFADVHQEAASVALPGGWTAKLSKRTEPLTVDMTIENYEEALRRVPFDVVLYEKLGYLHLRKGDWPRAEELIRQAAQMAPTRGWPYRALGYLYQRQGLEEQAAVEYRNAIEKEPFERKAYRYLADLFVSRGDLQKAIDVFALAVQNNPRLAWPHLELGSLYVQESRLPQAVAAYQQAARMGRWSEAARVRLQETHWSLASSLGTAKAHADDAPLTWWLEEAWVRPYPLQQDVMVGHSVLGVEGLIQPDQIHLHPFGAAQDTYLRFDVENCRYDTLEIAYGLADQVAGLSNGVRYTLQASLDGGNSYAVLWDQAVTDSVWQSQVLPLIAYWGEDVTFQLAVDALGDDRHDWLQTTVRLFPPLEVWDLATNLGGVQVAAADAPLSWRAFSVPAEGGTESPSGWLDADGRPLVTVSRAPVHGAARDNQVQFHPFSDHQDTSINFLVRDNPYPVLRTAYALADEVVELSDGVDYEIAVSTDDGRAYTSLLKREIVQNTWDTATLDLSAYLDRDLTIQLVSSSRGEQGYDWLQITLDLIATHERAQNQGEME